MYRQCRFRGRHVSPPLIFYFRIRADLSSFTRARVPPHWIRPCDVARITGSSLGKCAVKKAREGRGSTSRVQRDARMSRFMRNPTCRNAGRRISRFRAILAHPGIFILVHAVNGILDSRMLRENSRLEESSNKQEKYRGHVYNRGISQL
jgi:hypothetical protein